MVALRSRAWSASGTRANTSRAELNHGSRGNEVRGIQRALRTRGYPVSEDGIYGHKTKTAIRDFQRSHGLAVDGIVGPETRGALSASLPSVGSRAGFGRGPHTTLGINNQVTDANRNLQRVLNAMGYRVAVDGQFGRATENALKTFQREHGLPADGVFGRQTLAAIRNVRGGAAPDAAARGAAGPHRPAVNGVEPARTPGAPANRTAQIESYRNRGQARQMATGKVTVNGKVYQFRSGGGGRGSLPPGDYKITPHLWSRHDKPTMQVDGVGYSFAMSDKYDSRVGGTRKLLRIHPDGGGAGTIGCLGIVGNGNVQRAFREDMRAELARNGGSFTLSVRP
jgi:hypothetical protein